MKRIIASVLLVSILVTALVACSNSNTSGTTVETPDTSVQTPVITEEQENQNENYYEIVSETQMLLDDVADAIYEYWYDCIYNDKYLENISYAVACAQEDNKDKIATIEENTQIIKELYKTVRDGELKDEIKDVMQAYNEYYSFVIEVSGSFESYSKGKEEYKKNLSNAMKNLSFEL